MSAKVRQLRPEAPAPLSPERATLADAIERHSAAARYIEQLRGATDKAFRLVSEARDAVDRAEEELAEARRDEPRLLADRLLGLEAEGPSPVAIATDELRRAVEALDLAQRTRDSLGTREGDGQRELNGAALGLKHAIAAIVAPSEVVARLLEEYADLRRRQALLSTLLWHLGQRGCLPRGADHRDDELPRDAATHATHQAALSPWESALKALETDANAPLPGADDDPSPAAA